MATDTAPKKPRKPRTNYEKIVRELRTYLTVKIEVLRGLTPQTATGGDTMTLTPPDAILSARVAELEAVLARVKE